MSYILDALNKSEEEKKQHRTPGLNTIHQSSEGRKTRRGPLLLIGIGLLIINLIALLIWWIFLVLHPRLAMLAQSLCSRPPLSPHHALTVKGRAIPAQTIDSLSMPRQRCAEKVSRDCLRLPHRFKTRLVQMRSHNLSPEKLLRFDFRAISLRTMRAFVGWFSTANP